MEKTESGYVVFPDNVLPNDTRLLMLNQWFFVNVNTTQTFYDSGFLPAGHYYSYLYSGILRKIWVAVEDIQVLHTFDYKVQIKTKGEALEKSRYLH